MLKPFWCYYGGKWRSAPHYPAPRHDVIAEACAGAAGYGTRYPDRQVILCEVDPVVAGLWRWLTATAWVGRPPCSARSRSARTGMRAGTHASSFWGREVRDRIASQVGAIKHWTLIEGSYDQAPDVEATWFVDPPYQKAGVHYRRRMSAADYEALGAWCRTRRGQVIACEAEGADWLPFRPLGTFKANESRTGGKKCSEVIWTNDA